MKDFIFQKVPNFANDPNLVGAFHNVPIKADVMYKVFTYNGGTFLGYVFHKEGETWTAARSIGIGRGMTFKRNFKSKNDAAEQLYGEIVFSRL